MDVKDALNRPHSLVLAAALVVILGGLKLASPIVVPLLLATFVAAIAWTPIRWLTAHRIPKWVAVFLVLLAVVVLLIGVGTVVVQSVNELYANQDSYVQRLDEIAQRFFSWIGQSAIPLSAESFGTVVNADTIWSLASRTLSGVGHAITSGFLILLVFVFIIAEGASLPQKIRSVLATSAIGSTRLDDFTTNINQYIVIKTLVSIVTGISVALGLWLIGVDFPVLWGLLAFLLNYIPNIGSVIAAVPAVLLALIQLDGTHVVLTIALFAAVNVAMGSFVEPRFLGHRLGLSTLVVFLSLIFWGFMFGTVGMLLAVPLTVMLKIAAESWPSTEWVGVLLGSKPSATPVPKTQTP